MRKLVPIGCYPKYLYEELLARDVFFNGGMEFQQILKNRMEDLRGAIQRYANAGLHINVAWVEEYNQKVILLNELTELVKTIKL